MPRALCWSLGGGISYDPGTPVSMLESNKKMVLGGGQFFMSELPLHPTQVRRGQGATAGIQGYLAYKKGNPARACDSGSEGSYLRLTDFCITHLYA